MIRTATSGHALTVTIDRPSRHNALNDAMIDALHAALDAAERSSDCRMVVLQSASASAGAGAGAGGHGVFCTGMDLEDAAGEPGDRATPRGAAFFRLLRRFTASPRVIVSIVDGRAEGGGVGLAAASDFVFASERARFGLPEALWGLLPSCVLPFLVRRTGVRTAYAMTLSTLPIEARKAEQVGLVDVVADDPGVPLRQLASRVTRLDAAMVGVVKRSFGRLSPIGDEVEAAALRELDERFASAFVQRAIAGFTGPRRSFPWER